VFALRDARHVLLTGAAGAIGASLADAIAASAPGARLTLVDKDRPGVDAVAARVRGHGVVWDLRAPGDLESAWSAAAAVAPVDVLVNCAGIMEMRSFAATSWATAGDLLAVDLVSPLRLMTLAVPAMRERRGGIVVNVASMAGLVPLRGASYYGAAKAGLAMASEIARLELAGDDVRVLTVYPGPVASGLERRARAQLRASWLARAVPTGDPRELARRIVLALDRGAPRVVYPPLYAFAAEALGVSRRVTESFSPEPTE
jgi:short-subunit dehydrogenase